MYKNSNILFIPGVVAGHYRGFFAVNECSLLHHQGDRRTVKKLLYLQGFTSNPTIIVPGFAASYS